MRSRKARGQQRADQSLAIDQEKDLEEETNIIGNSIITELPSFEAVLEDASRGNDQMPTMSPNNFSKRNTYDDQFKTKKADSSRGSRFTISAKQTKEELETQGKSRWKNLIKTTT